MNTTMATTSASLRTTVTIGARPQPIPWYLWACLVAGFCIAFGLYWDISWHESIGRDTFWTPAHLLIQFGAVLAGIYSSFLIFGTTFGNNQAAQDASVNVLGFRGPFGAFVCAWGGAAMIAFEPMSTGVPPLQYVAAARSDWPLTWNAVHQQAPRGRHA